MKIRYIAVLTLILPYLIHKQNNNLDIHTVPASFLKEVTNVLKVTLIH